MPDDNDTEETDTEKPEATEPLTWLVKKGDLIISSDHDAPDQQVRISAMVEDDVILSIEDAREVLTHALAHMGGGSDRADTEVAQVAMDLCAHHAKMREQAEIRLARLQEAHALQARHLGEYMGRLKQYEQEG